MPYRSEFVPPEVVLKHNGIEVFAVYKNDEIENGARTFTYTLDHDASEGDGQCFDVRELPHSRIAAIEPLYSKEWYAERNSVIARAIDDGVIQPPATVVFGPPAPPTVPELLDSLRSAFADANDWLDSDIDCQRTDEDGSIVHESGCACNALVSASKYDDASQRFHDALDQLRRAVKDHPTALLREYMARRNDRQYDQQWDKFDSRVAVALQYGSADPEASSVVVEYKLCACEDDDCPEHRGAAKCLLAATVPFLRAGEDHVELACPGCAHEWEVAGDEPLEPTCPHCGSAGFDDHGVRPHFPNCQES